MHFVFPNVTRQGSDTSIQSAGSINSKKSNNNVNNTNNNNIKQDNLKTHNHKNSIPVSSIAEVSSEDSEPPGFCFYVIFCIFLQFYSFFFCLSAILRQGTKFFFLLSLVVFQNCAVVFFIFSSVKFDNHKKSGGATKNP